MLVALLGLSGISAFTMDTRFGPWLSGGIGALGVLFFLGVAHEYFFLVNNSHDSSDQGVAVLFFAGSLVQLVPSIGLVISGWTWLRPNRSRIGLAVLAVWFAAAYSALGLGVVSLYIVMVFRGLFPQFLLSLFSG